jgi:hypothetical protein
MRLGVSYEHSCRGPLRAGVAPMQARAWAGLIRRTLMRSGTLGLVVLAVASLSQGCAMSPADRDATVRAWEARDAERARECPGRFIAGGCVGGGGP